MDELGLVIKAARERIPLTLREAGVKSGISNAYLNQIENGRIKRPSPDILNRISNLYGIPYDVLLDKAGHPMPGRGTDEQGQESPVTVLIIDDDPNDRELYRSYLENAVDRSFIVSEAESGQEAFRFFEKTIPDCVLLDYRMPGTDGLEVLGRIRKTEMLKYISVVMMTSQGSEAVAVSAMKLGAVNYFVKDLITDDKLVHAVMMGLKRKDLLKAVRTRIKKTKQAAGPPEFVLKQSIERILKALERIRSGDGPCKDDPDIIAVHSEILDLAQLLSLSGGDGPGVDPEEEKA